MGLMSRDISVEYGGHEILLSVRVIGGGASYKLYIEGNQVDEQSLFGMFSFFGGPVVLRGQLPPHSGESKRRLVKVVANFRLIKSNDYVFYLDEEQIHQERATFGGI